MSLGHAAEKYLGTTDETTAGTRRTKENMAIKEQAGRTLNLIVDYDMPPPEIDHSLFYPAIKALIGDTFTVSQLCSFWIIYVSESKGVAFWTCYNGVSDSLNWNH